MLVSLHVKNMALIREEEILFGPGLNILTGETGAGKSILIGSISLALGTGSFKDYIPEDADYALVELLFETQDPAALERLEQAQIPVTDGEVLITRKYQNGRTINRINGESVPAGLIRELAGHLIDIHGQHQHQSLLYPKNHLRLLDRFAAEKLGDLPRQCAQAYKEFSQAQKELQEAQLDASERAKQIDLIEYELNEIDSAGLRPGEDEELEQLYNRMSHSQKIAQAIAEASGLISSDDGAGDRVSRAARAVSAVSDLDEQLEQLQQGLAQIEDLLSELGRSLADCEESFAFDEQECYETERRLDLVNHLKSKYGRTIEEVLAYGQAQQEKLDQLTDYEAYIERLKKQEAKSREAFRKLALEIRGIRREHAKVLEQQITQALVDLNFLDVRFGIEFTELKEGNASGMDGAEMRISTNPGMPMRPLQDTASGGELSRIMLALKSVMADQDAIGTLIFDEIDTGISGRTAQKVSEKMAVIAASHQILCITHLAQIAAMADTHFEIEKATRDGHTTTRIRQLSEEEIIEELARILGGVSVTQTVRESAQEMKRLADEIKRR
ncbi:MAG: DNA repair protein RecN [Lachnospiraceae bacterium]|nr:DNA repair protein RecN [Lachnospiraceae bacterium]